MLQPLVELLRRGHAVRLIARGGSMWPSIRDGARLLIEPRFPRLGEVAAALHQGELLLHRVVKLDSLTVKLRGDALDRVEEVPRDAVLGAVASRSSPLLPLYRLFARVRRRVS